MAAEVVLTFAAEGILKKVLSLAKKEFSLACGFKAELKKLQESVTHIELLLLDVAKQPQGRLKSVDAWVKKLKDVADDAEDVFDELEYEVYRRKVEIQDHMKKKVLNFFSLSNPLAFCLIMAHKLQKINASLVDLERKASSLGLVSTRNTDATTQGIRWDRQTNAFFSKEEITVGRKDDVSKIVTALTDSKYNQENLGVMAIVGMGGLGKTTLAKSIYNEDSIHKFFEKKIWICVSDTFEVNFILHQMSEQLNREKAPSKDNQNTLLLSLNEELKDKKYLLVLDDVWNEESKIWESFMECLSKLSSAKGSKIIVTTRKEKVALTTERLLPRHELGKLSRDQCWSIMKNRACSSNSDPEFDTIGREIAEKCHGVPLVAKSSLFQDATMSDNGIVSECKMHDLVHDLAELVSKSESLKGDLCGRNNTLEIRHVARVSISTLEKILERSARKLRSLFSDDDEIPINILPRFKALRVLNLSNADIEELPVSIGRLKHLRYLDISETIFETLPKSIGKLYNLQTLRAMNCALEEFPKELQNLINLRHIYFDEDIEFPQGIHRLTCLRTLPYFSVGNEIGRRIEELAGLKQLKGELIVCNLQLVKNGEEAKKAKLEDKTKIRHLSFNWTANRSTTNNNEEDVLEGLRPHCELESLSIENFMGNKFPPWMMSGSLPLNNLKRIQLLGCDKCEGVPPLGHLPSLTELKIRGMANLKCVGAEFYGYDLVHNVATTSEEVITLFPALKVLYISGCGNLNEWKQAPTTSRKKVVVFPCLEMLTVKNCFKLRNAPSHFPCLQKLMFSYDSRMPIEEISSGLTTLTSLEIKGIMELTCLPPGILKKNNNLYSLVIENCDDLTCITPDVVGSCGSLKKLVIWNCEKLRHLPDGLDTLPFLEELIIEGCPSLELIPIEQGMASLRELTIKDCGRLSRLPSELKNCTSLRQLSIKKCDGLSGPLSLGASLVELRIDYCNNLTSIEMKGSGSLTASLQKLSIWFCNELTSIPALPQQCPSLQELDIRGCPKLSWVGVKSRRVEKEEKCISLQFPLSLDTLVIQDIPNLQILPSLDNLNSLRDLRIGGFWEELDSFPFPDFQVGSLMHLEWLTLYGWPKLKSLPQQIQHLTSLTSLWIYYFEGVETLPEWLGSLTSLIHLKIEDCKNLMNLPSVQAMQRLTKLRRLFIFGCHPLLKDSSTDWPKISHIPLVSIGHF